MTDQFQGIIIIALGIAAPYISANYNWRYLYYATSGAGIIAWLLLIALLPETRWTRSTQMLGKMNELNPAMDPTRNPQIEYIY